MDHTTAWTTVAHRQAGAAAVHGAYEHEVKAIEALVEALRISMHSELKEQEGGETVERPEQLVLEGVSKIIDGDPQSDGFISGLDNIVQFLGEENQYPYLLGMSGRGFRVLGAPSPEPHEGESSTARPEEVHDLPSVRAAVEATGYDFEILGNREGPWSFESDAFTSSVDNAGIREAVLKSIGGGRRPVLALMQLNSSTHWWWGILTGYRNGGDEVLGCPGEDGTFSAGEWEKRVVVLIRLVGEKDADHGNKKKDLYRKALKLALQSMASGSATYDSFLNWLAEDVSDVSDEILAERLGGFSGLFIGELASNRWYASLFLRSINTVWSDSALLHAAGNFARIHELAWECWKIAGGYWREAETEVPRFRNRENRREMAAIVKEIKDLEEDTAEQIRIALEKWDKTHAYYMSP